MVVRAVLLDVATMFRSWAYFVLEKRMLAIAVFQRPDDSDDSDDDECINAASQ